MNSKIKTCPYMRICNQYDENSLVCNKEPSGYCGSYRIHKAGVI